MMKRISLTIVLIFLCLLSAASAECFKVPGSIVAIESQAFENTALGYDAVALAPSVTSIASDAFSSHIRTVYGAAGSAAEQYARATGRTFVDAGIAFRDPTLVHWSAPNTPVTLRVNASSPRAVQSYRVQLELNGEVVLSTPWQDSADFTLTVNRGGDFDVRVFARHDLFAQEYLYKDRFTVGQPIRFSSDNLRLAVGETVSLLDASETRAVSFKVESSYYVKLSGSSITGQKVGKTQLTATVTEPGGVITVTVPVEVRVPVTAVTIKTPPSYLYVGKTHSLSTSVSPYNATYNKPTYTSSDSGVISVDASGKLTAIAPGVAVITAEADGVTASVEVAVEIKPTSVRLEYADPDTVLYTGCTAQIVPVVSPEGAYYDKIAWRVGDTYYATVDADGLIKCLRPGDTKVTCTIGNSETISASLSIKVLQGPKTITLSAVRPLLFEGSQLQINAAIDPANAANKTLRWTTSDSSIATVDPNGLVTPTGVPGVVTITATAVNGVCSAITLRAYDQKAPMSFALSDTELFLNKGDTYTLVSDVLPAGAFSDAEWTSTDPSVVQVDENGTLTALTFGSSRVTVTSTVDASVAATCVVVVLNPNRTLSMPARRTGVSGISANLSRINALKTSAYDELKELYAAGKITAAVMSSRQTVINRAFDMYMFPWMTLNKQSYWNADNSEGGAKDFKPGTVYYGLPYISGSFNRQRLYNAEKAVNDNRYYRSSDGDYFILNQDNLLEGTYCGNDCSSFVSFSYFSQSTAESRAWRTNHFAETSDFTTLKKDDELYPGDILVKSYSHVVLFLYYANPEHTQAVIVEQGGIEAAINTVNASVYNLNYYWNNGYIPRRYTSWK